MLTILYQLFLCLIDHKTQIIVAMTYLDYAANPWRHIIIPVAVQSPSLLSAILAFSAKHMNAMSLSNSKRNMSTVPSLSSNLEQNQ
jgi:hypothetical protein